MSKGLKNPDSPTGVEVSRVVVHDGYDDMAYEAVANYKNIKSLTDTSSNKALVQDVFTSYYRTEPALEEAASGLRKDIMEELHSMKEFKDFHETSQLDEVASAIGSLEMVPPLLKKLEEVEEKIKEQREQQQKENVKEGKDPNEGVPQGEFSLSELSEKEQGALRQAIRAAIEEGQTKSEEHQALMRQWGVEPGEIKTMDAKERLELADKLKKAGTLKNISDLIGRLKNVMTSALATITSHGSDEIVDIGIGSDVQRMIPSESLKLALNPMLFYKDMLEGNLMVYNLQGVENKGKGPLLVLFDISGSMMGSREAWAKAVVLTLMSYAQKEKRTFGWVSFNEAVHDSRLFMAGEHISIDEKLKLASVTTTGGTEYWPALQKARSLHAQEPMLKPADIVFITDGECEIGASNLKQFNEWKKEKDVRVYGIGIAGFAKADEVSMESLETFCDKICLVNDHGDVSALKDVVQTIKKETRV